MEINRFNFCSFEEVSTLLTNCLPYVFPHHPYVYWIMGEYFPSLCFVAQEDNSIVGFICAFHSVEKDSVFLWQLAVDGAYRRTGTAVLLCEKIIEYARNNRISSLQITIDDENTASFAFFSALAKQYGSSIEKIANAGLDRFKGENAYIIEL